MVEANAKQQEIRVLLVDDKKDVAGGLRMILEAEPELSVVGVAADGYEAVAEAERLVPQVVVMDVKMPRMDGLEATRRLKELDPRIRVILLSMYDHGDLVQKGLGAGASFYLLKGGPIRQLLEAIKQAV